MASSTDNQNLRTDIVSGLVCFFRSYCLSQILEDDSTNRDLPPEFNHDLVRDFATYFLRIGPENESLYNLSNGEVQLITNFIKSHPELIIPMLEDGSNNLDLPPRFDDSQDEADNDADEMVQDYVADLPLIGQENESLPNLSNGEVQLITNFVESLSIWMPEDGSTNWNSPPRFDVTPDESDDAVDDADEMVQDYVADLPLIGLENESLYNLSNSEVQLIHEFIESLSNWMPEDGSPNWNLPPRYDVTPDESDDDADEMVQDNVADLPLEAHVEPDDVESLRILSDLEPQLIDECNEPLSNLCDPESQWIDEFIESPSNQMVQDGSTNWDSPPRFDATPDESDDADEIVQDYVADLPLEAHVVPDDVADLLLEAHVVEDRVANLQLEAHVVPDDVADVPQLCTICATNTKGMAFIPCGHTTCVECGEMVEICPFCRKAFTDRLRLF